MSIFRNLFGSKEKREKREEEKHQPEEVEAHITTLQDTNKSNYARSDAARALGETKDARAVEPLITAFKNDSDELVRREAALALGELKDARAVEPLITALWKDRGNVRESAAWALGEIKDSRAVEQLIVALKNAIRSRNYLVLGVYAKALGKIKEANADEPLIDALVEPLIDVLKDSDINMTKGAAKALGEIKDARAVEPLIAELKAAIKVGNTILSPEIAKALGKIKNASAIEPLIALLKHNDSSEYVRQVALDALDEIGGLTAAQTADAQQAIVIVPQVETLMKKFVEAGVELERNAFTRFAKHGFTGLGTTNDLSEIKESSKALQDCGTAAVDPLCNFLENYNVGGTDLTFACKEAIFVLGNLGDKKAIPAIEKFISNHSYAEDIAKEAIKKIGSKLS